VISVSFGEELQISSDVSIARSASLSTLSPLPPALSPPSHPPSPSAPNDKPCFARDTEACRLLDPIPPEEAYAQCFGGVPQSAAERVPMFALRAGDEVLDSAHSAARIIVNQHRQEGGPQSQLLTLSHTGGQLQATPDHVLVVDGTFASARTVGVGSKLGEHVVLRVTSTRGEIVNPLTNTGRIIAAGPGGGGGVLASTYPEWVALYMLSCSLVPIPLSISNAITYFLPELAQTYYDSIVEPFVTRHHPATLKAVLPTPLVPSAFLFADLALSAGFVAFSLASPMVALAIATAAVAAAKARKY